MGQQLFATSSLGGYFTNNTLSSQLRFLSQTMQRFRQFTDMEPAAGAGRGQSVFFDKISNISTAGGTLTETDTIPKRNYTITQGTLTMTEYGNSVPFTAKVKSLSDIMVPETIRTVLQNDMKVVLDSPLNGVLVANNVVKFKLKANGVQKLVIYQNGKAVETMKEEGGIFTSDLKVERGELMIFGDFNTPNQLAGILKYQVN